MVANRFSSGILSTSTALPLAFIREAAFLDSGSSLSEPDSAIFVDLVLPLGFTFFAGAFGFCARFARGMSTDDIDSDRGLARALPLLIRVAAGLGVLAGSTETAAGRFDVDLAVERTPFGMSLETGVGRGLSARQHSTAIFSSALCCVLRR
jgi:hypothetical protein